MEKLLSHFLIGPPSSGKSTFATRLTQLDRSIEIVSTDAIRALLFGDESIQGDWSVIEEIVLSQIREALSAGRPVIYDATNAKPDWRVSMLRQLSDEKVQWIAWHFKTPLEVCKLWNKKRNRQVPENVIEELYQALKNFPPLATEGFVAVNSVIATEEGFNLQQIERQLQCF